MEERARSTASFEARIAVYVNLGELRWERNESAAAQRDFQTALQLADSERDDARRDLDFRRYATACAWSGVALAGLGRGVEAFAVLEEGVRYGADLRGVWNLYSFAMFRLHRPEKAIGAARMSVAATERKTAARATVRELLELNFDRFALAQSLLGAGGDATAAEAEQVLRRITESLDSEAFASLRKSLGKREEFQILTAPTTESGMYLSVFNRAHMRLARIYESRRLDGEARREYQAVVSRRSDEAAALAGLARLAAGAKERDRYLIQSLDANPFADDVVAHYERHVVSGDASPAAPGGSVGSRVRMAIQQIHARDFRRARETLAALIESHPNNDVLQSLLARAFLRSGDVEAARAANANVGDPALRWEVERLLEKTSGRPWFLDKPVGLVTDPSEVELRAVLSLFAGNRMSAEDRATLNETRFSSSAMLDASHERGTIHGVPFRFQSAARSVSAGPQRVVYRILGATTLDGRDALLIEPAGAETAE